eukprot:1348224-Pleurochrysis_carterae.AAC.1
MATRNWLCKAPYACAPLSSLHHFRPRRLRRLMCALFRSNSTARTRRCSSPTRTTGAGAPSHATRPRGRRKIGARSRELAGTYGLLVLRVAPIGDAA